MPKKLSDIELDEVTVCEEPANDDCVAVIVKSKSRRETEMSMQDDNIQVDDEPVEDADLDLDFTDEELQAVADEMEELGEDLVPAFAAMLAANEEATEVIGKMAEAFDALDEEHEELKKSAAALVDRVEKMRADGKAGEEETDLVASVRKSLGGAELDPATEKRLAAVELVAKQAEEKEAVEKAKSLGVGDPKELAPILQAVRKKLGAETGDKLEAILKSAGAALKKSKAFERAGVDYAVDASSPIAKARQGAAEIKKANPNMSDAQAMTAYFDQNPEAYAEYRESQARAA